MSKEGKGDHDIIKEIMEGHPGRRLSRNFSASAGSPPPILSPLPSPRIARDLREDSFRRPSSGPSPDEFKGGQFKDLTLDDGLSIERPGRPYMIRISPPPSGGAASPRSNSTELREKIPPFTPPEEYYKNSKSRGPASAKSTSTSVTRPNPNEPQDRAFRSSLPPDVVTPSSRDLLETSFRNSAAHTIKPPEESFKISTAKGPASATSTSITRPKPIEPRDRAFKSIIPPDVVTSSSRNLQETPFRNSAAPTITSPGDPFQTSPAKGPDSAMSTYITRPDPIEPEDTAFGSSSPPTVLTPNSRNLQETPFKNSATPTITPPEDPFKTTPAKDPDSVTTACITSPDSIEPEDRAFGNSLPPDVLTPSSRGFLETSFGNSAASTVTPAEESFKLSTARDPASSTSTIITNSYPIEPKDRAFRGSLPPDVVTPSSRDLLETSFRNSAALTTLSSPRTLKREFGNISRARGANIRIPTFDVESKRPIFETERPPIVRRPTGWVKKVEWQADFEEEIEEEDKPGPEPNVEVDSFSSSSSSSSSSPSSLSSTSTDYQALDKLKAVELGDVEGSAADDDTASPSCEATDHGLNTQMVDIDLNPACGISGHQREDIASSAGATPSMSSESYKSSPLRAHSPPMTASTPIINELKMDVNSVFDQHFHESGEFESRKSEEEENFPESSTESDESAPNSESISGASGPMSSEVRYLRRRSSSGLPTQESDLLKKWARKNSQRLQARQTKSTLEHDKILEAAQRAKDAFHVQRKRDLEVKRAQNRIKEQEKISSGPTERSETGPGANPWEVVVSLVDLDRSTSPLPGGPPLSSTGPPKAKSQNNKEGLDITVPHEGATVSRPSGSPLPLVSPWKILRKRAGTDSKPIISDKPPTGKSLKKEGTAVVTIATTAEAEAGGDTVTGPVERPSKRTDLTRLKQILIKLKHQPPIRNITS